jgi:uncharacterized protein with PQ loop repeat
MNYVDITGYIATILLIISFTFKNVNTLRKWNSAACLTFIIYGILINSYPLIISNSFILLFNLYFLIKKENN